MTFSSLPEDPVVSCFDDDIMNEVALFMDVAMVQPDSAPVTEDDDFNSEILLSTMPMPTPVSSSSSVASVTSDHYTSPATTTYYTLSTDLSQQTEFSVPNPFAALAIEEPAVTATTATTTTTTTTTTPANTSVPAPTTPVTSKPLPTASELSEISLQSTFQEAAAAAASVVTPLKVTSEAEIHNEKKRRWSTVSTSSDEEATVTSEMPVDKRQRNRDHAKKSRQRKKNLTLTLQTSVQELKAENNSLKELIRSKWGEEAMDSLKEENQLSPAEKFINALQMPGSKFMSKSTLTFLKSYSDTVQASLKHNAFKHQMQ